MKKVLLCVAESDTHVVANKLIEKLLAENGIEVINLGPCTSLKELAKAYESIDRVDLIAIGSLNGHALEDLSGLQLFKRRFHIRCPIVVGGNLSVGTENKEEARELLKKQGVDIIMTHPREIIDFLNNDLNNREVRGA